MEEVIRHQVEFSNGLMADMVYAADFDRVTAEREALQLLLNNRDDQLTSLEQRRYAEKQAREAAERRVEELNDLVKKAHIWVDRNNCGGWDAYELRDQLAAALNPTAEAVSHE